MGAAPSPSLIVLLVAGQGVAILFNLFTGRVPNGWNCAFLISAVAVRAITGPRSVLVYVGSAVMAATILIAWYAILGGPGGAVKLAIASAGALEPLQSLAMVGGILGISACLVLAHRRMAEIPQHSGPWIVMSATAVVVAASLISPSG